MKQGFAFSALLLALLACSLLPPGTPVTVQPDTDITQATAVVQPDQSGQPTQPMPAPTQASADGAPIPAASAPVVADCSLFDLGRLDAMINGSLSFVAQDQLGNCIFESDNNFRLLIGGGKPSSSDAAQAAFNSSFASLPGATWEYIDGFYLGTAASSVSVTAQGVSASGHTLVIVAASASVADSQVLLDLAREAARQLNAQF